MAPLQQILIFDSHKTVRTRNIHRPFPQIIRRLRRGSRFQRRWYRLRTKLAPQAIEIRAEAIVQHIPAGDIHRDIQPPGDVGGPVEDLNAWAGEGVARWIAVVLGEEFLALWTGGHTGGLIGPKRGGGLVEDADIVAEAVEHDAVHEAGEGAADLSTSCQRRPL